MNHGCCCCLQADRVVFVRCSNGDVHAVTMKSDDTVAALKTKLFDCLGIDPTAQRLACCGQLLSDEDALVNRRARIGATIDLSELPSTASAPVTVAAVRRICRCFSSIAVILDCVHAVLLQFDMAVVVKVVNGVQHILEVKPHDTILMLKQKLTEKLGIALAEQRLTCAVQCLDNGSTFADYGIETGATLTLWRIPPKTEDLSALAVPAAITVR